MKLFYFDLETTGVKFWKNGIHQISGIIEIDGVIKETFNFLVSPYHDAIIEEEAMTVGKVTAAQIKLYPPMQQVYNQLVALMAKYVDKYDKKDKFFLVGYNNASFDNPFLRAFFVQNGDNYFGSWFWSSSIDVMVLASQALMIYRKDMENFKLSTVAKHFSIDTDEHKLHEAGYDVYLTREIYKCIEVGIK